MAAKLISESTGIRWAMHGGEGLAELSRLPVECPFPHLGRIRLKFRPQSFVMAYVRTAEGIREFIARIQDGKLIIDLRLEQRANIRLSHAQA